MYTELLLWNMQFSDCRDVLRDMLCNAWNSYRTTHLSCPAVATAIGRNGSNTYHHAGNDHIESSIEIRVPSFFAMVARDVSCSPVAGSEGCGAVTCSRRTKRKWLIHQAVEGAVQSFCLQADVQNMRKSCTHICTPLRTWTA